MNSNMKAIITAATAIIYEKYKNDIPSVEQINKEAGNLRIAFPVSDEEFKHIEEILQRDLLHTVEESIILKGQDSEHYSWYNMRSTNDFYWKRYEKYLIQKKWYIKAIDRINMLSDSIMDELGNPLDSRPFQRRGLILGDVQSGKTATYTAICNKAADAGYKVIIVLAGMMENLRVQTQGRLDMEFSGTESRYAFDKNADNSIRNKRVGVGELSRGSRNIARFTTVTTDFNKRVLNSFGLRLGKDPALFVVKKNKSVLNNLKKWLVENNTEQIDDPIDLPLLLIDDEADNASINTNNPEKDPTAINKAIREILNCFKKASYLGITATPFANIFIDPETAKKMENQDLFPKDFISVMPRPDNYIGPDKIFGEGNIDAWDKNNFDKKIEGEYSKAIVPIYNDEQEEYFVFKHKKELADELDNLPESLYEAIRYFVLATAILDNRLGEIGHRTMLVNVSRFTAVQNTVTDLIQNYIDELKADVYNYSKLSVARAERASKHILELHVTWEKFNMSKDAKIPWNKLMKTYLNKATKRIEVRAINQNNSSKSLNYYAYNDGLRLIAVGGNSLSRGLTLEGLCVSYFYRNTVMYDTLLQMGRWFGYRDNYDDIFKIWMGEDAIDWYGYISDAIIELKDELRTMERENQTPKEFGLKVRQAPCALLVTARNKMRSTQKISSPITLSGRMIETPRLYAAEDIVSKNEEICKGFIQTISLENNIEKVYYDEYTNAYIWRNVPKKFIVELVSNFKSHPWNLNFQPTALADYINEDDGKLDFWDVGIPIGGEKDNTVNINIIDEKLKIIPEGRKIEVDPTAKNLLKINGHHVRVGSGGCSKIGLSKEKIQELRKGKGSIKDKTYLIENRNPIALIHILKNTSEPQKSSDPDIIFALGLGFPSGEEERTAKYVINITELKNLTEFYEEEDEDE